MAKRYIISSRFSDYEFRQLNRLFALDLEAVEIAQMVGLHRTTVDRHLLAMRAKLQRSVIANYPS